MIDTPSYRNEYGTESVIVLSNLSACTLQNSGHLFVLSKNFAFPPHSTHHFHSCVFS